MQFPSATPSRTQFLNQQMNGITGNSFIDVFSKNDELKRNLVSIREKRDAVKEILSFNNNGQNGSFLYFNGNFDPVKVRQLAKEEGFKSLGDGIINQFIRKGKIRYHFGGITFCCLEDLKLSIMTEPRINEPPNKVVNSGISFKKIAPISIP